MRSVLVAVALLAVACAARAQAGGAAVAFDGLAEIPQPADPVASDPEPARESASAAGLASWYGLGFHGRRTASGERFNMNALTAAHPWLPFGTRVLVQNPVNGRSVVVRINDRGPHVAGRIIDLSHAAARALGLLGWGTKSVVVTPVPDGRTR